MDYGLWTKPGFTLFEILMVLGLIGLLLGIGLPTFYSLKKRAKINRAIADIHRLEVALSNFHSDQGYYPRVMLAGVKGQFGDEGIRADLGLGKEIPCVRPAEVLVYYLGCKYGNYLYGNPAFAPNKTPYMEFDTRELKDTDNDGWLEFIDPWGSPYIYVGDNPHPPAPHSESDNPWNNEGFVDLTSLGPDCLGWVAWEQEGSLRETAEDPDYGPIDMDGDGIQDNDDNINNWEAE